MKTKNEKAVIVVTDSGFGGLNVMVNAYKLLQKLKPYKEIDLIFYNALPDENFGYNQMESMEEKARVFDSVLEEIESNYSPDIILVACNTLSVVFENSRNKKLKQLPVTGIVDTGVRLIHKGLVENVNSKVIIVGTPTTIGSNSHKNKLLKKGIDPERIIPIPCYQLESEIQNNPNSEIVIRMIDYCLGDITNKISKNEEIYLALCCTHYEFSLHLFEKYLKDKGMNFSIINPNDFMLDELIHEKHAHKFSQTRINLSVVSRTKVKPEDIKVLSSLVSERSPDVAKAVKAIKYQPPVKH